MIQEIKKNTPRDLFLHLLAVVALYWSSISFVSLLWQFINYYFPDNLSYVYYVGFSGPIRFAIASLVIIFPVFISVSWYLNKIYRRESAVRESKIRKWLIYLTLFIASLVIIGDLVSVINTFLGGEITARFALKAFSVLLVAVIIFGYYLDDVRRETPTGSAKYFAWVSGTIVLVTIVAAFFIVGSPATARLIQYDQQKVSDLQGIQSQIVNYLQNKGSLPATLSALNDSISGYSVPTDLQTKASYEYNIKDAANLSFELCATFNKPIPKNVTMALYPVRAGIDQNWDHTSGRVCFERTIDKQFYPILRPQPLTK